MEAQINSLQREAYCSLLRAFKARSDALISEKEDLMARFRKEFRIQNSEHKELVARVNGEDVTKTIRERRLAGAEHQNPRKRQERSSSKALSKKSRPYHSGGNQSPGDADMVNVRTESRYSLIGRRVQIRWPEDYNFYEAVITDYNPTEDQHALVYAVTAPDQQAFEFEWIDLKEIPSEDIRWEGLDSMALHPDGYGGFNQALRRMEFAKDRPTIDTTPAPDTCANKDSDIIKLCKTEMVLEEVEKILRFSHQDPLERGRAEKILDEQEQALIEAITKITKAESSRNKSDSDTISTPIDFADKDPDVIKLLNTGILLAHVEKMLGSRHHDPRQHDKAERILEEHEQALTEAIARLAKQATDAS